MARRSSAASGTSRSSRGKSAAGPRVRSDGKVDIYCPQCGAHYRLAETALDSKVTCRECTRTFFAKTTAGKRTRPKDYTSTYVGIGIGVLVIIGSLIALSRCGGYEVPERNLIQVQGPSQLDIDRRARSEAAVKWAQRVATGDLFAIRESSDLDALGQALGVAPNPDRAAYEAAVVTALRTNHETRLLHELECTGAEVDAESAQGNRGKARLFLTVRAGDTLFDHKTRGEMIIDFRMDGSTLKVTGYQLAMKPVQRGLRPGEGGDRFKPSADIARPEVKEIEHGGQKIQVRESQPVPLPHEAGTSPELQQKIDALVADLIRSADPDAPGRLFGSTSRALEQIGKPAVPRLLNALHDLYPDVMANNQKISQIDRCLLTMTGMQFAYDVRGTGNPERDKAARESVVRQWFAWWWRYANDTHTDAIEKEEDLLGPAKDKPKPRGN